QMKQIKPPRKICFAIKSQQKSAMFLSGANFVHFFATSDKSMASTWYEVVQQWRSWYLVNVLGEGQEKSNSRTALHSGRPATAGSGTSGPYQPGSFKPLLDFGLGESETENVPFTGSRRPSQRTAESSHTRNLSSRGRGAP